VTAPEFSRAVKVDTIGVEPRHMAIEAEPEERAALARRFGLVAIDRLAAEADVARKGAAVIASGRVTAAVTQSCVASGEPVEAAIDEPFEVEFRPTPAADAEEEVELGKSELDVVFFDGGAVDLGEAAAETVALALDPYPRAPGAAEALKAAGVKSEEEAGPFGALAGLRDKLKKGR
jgi:uncharacterized metal-binding protein YceD (DUF177 family)